MIGGVVVEGIVNISNRGSNIENQTENLKYVSSHPYPTCPSTVTWPVSLVVTLCLSQDPGAGEDGRPVDPLAGQRGHTL